MAMSRSGSKPERRIICSASSMIETGSPMSSTKISPPCAERARPDDELHGLGDRHEVAGHPRVGDRDRPARRDLPPEDRHDRARRAEHVAEADGRVLRGRDAAHAAASSVHSASALVAPITVRGVDGLVGRDEHEASSRRASPAMCATSRVAERVVADRLDGVGLHQRRRACRRRRGRRPPGGAARTPRACAPPRLQSASTAGAVRT